MGFIKTIREWLQGKKTYIVTAFGLLAVWLSYGLGVCLSAECAAGDALTLEWAITTSFVLLGFSTVRAGVSNGK